MTGPSRYDQFIPGGTTRQQPLSRYDAFVPQESEEEKRQREERERREREERDRRQGILRSALMPTLADPGVTTVEESQRAKRFADLEKRQVERELSTLGERAANRFLTRGSSIMSALANMAPGDVGSEAAKTWQELSQGIEGQVPAAKTITGKIASGIGYVGPDVLATILGGRMATGLAEASALGRAGATGLNAAQRAQATAELASRGNQAARLAEIFRGSTAKTGIGGLAQRATVGAVASAPLVTIPGALADDPRLSATGGVGERYGVDVPKPLRLAGDIAVDVGAGFVGEGLMAGGGRGLSRLAQFFGIGDGAAGRAAGQGPSLPTRNVAQAEPARRALAAGPTGIVARATYAAEQAAGETPIFDRRLGDLRRQAEQQASAATGEQMPLDVNARLQRLREIREMMGQPAIEVVPAIGGNVVRQQEDAAARAARETAEREARRQRAVQIPDAEATARLEAAAAQATPTPTPGLIGETPATQPVAQEATARLEQAAQGLKSRAGALDPVLFTTVAQSAGGGLVGAAFGDTPEERLAYGLAGATAANVPSIIRRVVRKPDVPITDPTTRKLLSAWQRANPKVEALAEEFMGGAMPRPLQRATALDPPFAKRIADWYDTAVSNPNDPEVQAAYRAFADETRRQFEFLRSKGIRFEFVDTDPYKNSSEMMQDVSENNRLKVLKTEAGMHPLLTEEENDMFRAVHDLFGHAKEGHQFGQLGEENAFRVHSAMYSPEARRVMATETRGQNSWVNNQPANKVKPGSVYAEQKVALMPEEFMGEYPIERVTPEVVTNVEMQSNLMKGFTDEEVRSLSNVNRVLGRAAFIRRVVEPIVKSEGLPVSVAKGLGSWISNTDGGANITEAARLTFDKMSPMAIQRVLARVSQAAKQMGMFFSVPNPNGESVSVTLDFGRSLRESEYKDAIEKLAAVDGGNLFSGTTMVKLDPAKVQIVLNDGVDEQGAEALVNLARQALPKYNTKATIQRVEKFLSENTDELDDAFADYFARIGYLTPEQAKVQQQAINAYGELAQAGPAKRALAAGPTGIVEGARSLADEALRRVAKVAPQYPPVAGGRGGAGAVEGVAGTPSEPFKVFDVTGATAEALRSPIGRQILTKGGVYGAGEIVESVGEGGETYDESPFLRETGRAMKGLALITAAYPAIKAGSRVGGAKIRDTLAQTPQGRFVLNKISRDILIDPRIREIVENTITEMARYRAIGRELAAEARKLGPAGDRLVSDLVEMENFENVVLDPNEMATAVALANRIADSVDKLGLAKVEQGLISQETYQARQRDYLRRIYARYAGEEAMEGVSSGAQAQPFRIKGEKQRLDLSPEQRNELGEIREASYRLTETFGRGGKDIATARMFLTLSDIPGVIEPQYKQIFEEAAMARGLRDAALASGDKEAARDASRAYLEAKNTLEQMRQTFKKGDEYVTLPDTPGLGVLRGAVVRRDAAEYLLMVDDWADTKHVWDKALQAWKKIHTVYNPGTHTGNFFSNAIIAALAGIPLPMQPFAMRSAYKDLKAYGPATRFLTENGILERGLPLYGVTPVKGLAEDKTALRTLARTTRPETQAALKKQGITPMSAVELMARERGNKITRAYALEDGIYRVMLFQRYVQDGMEPEAAMKKMMEALPGYDTRSPILKALKNTVSPFVMFPAKYIPAALNLIMEHPERWVAVAAMWGGLNEASRRLYEPLEQTDLPPNQRGYNYLIPGRIQVDAIARPAFDLLGIEPPPGDKYTFDVARWTPFSAITGSPAPGAIATQISEDIPGILQPGGPIADIGALMVNRDPFTGEEVIQPGMTGGEKARAVGGRLASLALPSAASFQAPRVIKDILRQDPAAAAIDMMGLVGLRPSVVRPGMEEWRQTKKYEQAVEGIKTRLERELRKSKNPERNARLEEEAAQAILREEQKFMDAITVRVPR